MKTKREHEKALDMYSNIGLITGMLGTIFSLISLFYLRLIALAIPMFFLSLGSLICLRRTNISLEIIKLKEELKNV